MLKTLLSLLPDSTLRSIVLGLARDAAKIAAGALGTWLAAHAASQTQTADAEQALTTLILTGAAVGLSIYDKVQVAKRLEAKPPAVPPSKES